MDDPSTAILVVAALLLVKESGLPVPVPGDLLVIGAGVAAAAATASSPLAGVAIVVLATIAGGAAQFALIRGPGRRAMLGLLARVGIGEARVRSRIAGLRGARSIALARMTPGLRIVAIPAAAIGDVPAPLVPRRAGRREHGLRRRALRPRVRRRRARTRHRVARPRPARRGDPGARRPRGGRVVAHRALPVAGARRDTRRGAPVTADEGAPVTADEGAPVAAVGGRRVPGLPRSSRRCDPGAGPCAGRDRARGLHGGSAAAGPSDLRGTTGRHTPGRSAGDSPSG